MYLSTGRLQLRPMILHGLAMILFFAGGTAAAQTEEDVISRIRGAERVVVGTITRVEPMAAENEFGDQLIISRLTLTVEEVLKGSPTSTITVDVEGGTLGDVTLEVSDMPLVTRGDRGVFFVDRASQGRHVLHQRGRGLLRLNRDGRSDETGPTLDSLRRGAATSGGAR